MGSPESEFDTDDNDEVPPVALSDNPLVSRYLDLREAQANSMTHSHPKKFKSGEFI